MKSHRGFALLNPLLLVTTVMLLGTISAPVIAELIRQSQTSAEANRLVAAINSAREQAMQRVASVTLCTSNDQRRCLPSTDWSRGWILKDEYGEVLRVWEALPTSLRLHASTTAITYRYTGFPTRPVTTFQLTDLSCYRDQGKRISVNHFGRASVTASGCPSNEMR